MAGCSDVLTKDACRLLYNCFSTQRKSFSINFRDFSRALLCVTLDRVTRVTLDRVTRVTLLQALNYVKLALK